MSNPIASSVQTAAYGVERTKQETGAAQNTAKATTAETHDDFQSKVDQAAREAHLKKEAAVSEGKTDVEQAKATTTSYLDQARGLVDTALGTAQSYVTAGQERLGANTTHSTAHVKSTGNEGPKAGGIADTLSGVAMSALESTKGVLATAQGKLAATGQSAQGAAKPHVESTKATVQPHVEAAQATIQPHVDAAASAAQPHIETAKQALPNSVVDTSTPSSTAATTGSTTTAATSATTTTSGPSSAKSPSTISYPSQPKTESHHVTTEPGAAPERADDKVVDKLADGLTSTKISDAAPAASTI